MSNWTSRNHQTDDYEEPEPEPTIEDAIKATPAVKALIEKIEDNEKRLDALEAGLVQWKAGK